MHGHNRETTTESTQEKKHENASLVAVGESTAGR